MSLDDMEPHLNEMEGHGRAWTGRVGVGAGCRSQASGHCQATVQDVFAHLPSSLKANSKSQCLGGPTALSPCMLLPKSDLVLTPTGRRQDKSK